jgi:hypothetical protein
VTLYNVGDTVRVLEVASTGLWASREGTYVLGGDDGENYPHTVNIPGVGAIGFRDEEIELVRRAPVPEPQPEVPPASPRPAIQGVPAAPGVYVDNGGDNWALLEGDGQWYSDWEDESWQPDVPDPSMGPFVHLYTHLKGLEA